MYTYIYIYILLYKMTITMMGLLIRILIIIIVIKIIADHHTKLCGLIRKPSRFRGMQNLNFVD